MNRYFFWLNLSILLALGSCRNNSVIPENNMVKILTKIYITDGVTFINAHSQLYGHDTIAYYEPIIESFGYTTAQFDSSIKYYSKRTERFDVIFDKVVTELSRLQDKQNEKSDENTTISEPSADGNLWPLKNRWEMAIDYTINPSLGFDIPVIGLGDYMISFDAQVFPEDEALNVRYYIFFYCDNKTPVGIRENSVLATYIKDGQVHKYSHIFKLENPEITHLKGWLYDHGNSDDKFMRKAIFSNFKVYYTPKTEDFPKNEKHLPKEPKFKEVKKIKVVEAER